MKDPGDHQGYATRHATHRPIATDMVVAATMILALAPVIMVGTAPIATDARKVILEKIAFGAILSNIALTEALASPPRENAFATIISWVQIAHNAHLVGWNHGAINAMFLPATSHLLVKDVLKP